MPHMDPELQQALMVIARQQGRDPNQLLAELLRGQLRTAPAPQPRQLPQPQRGYGYQNGVEVLPPAAPAPPRPQMQLPQRYAGVPNPQSEADFEVLQRYLEVESGEQGVFGDGGMSAGGVFGDSPVATAGHDPTAAARAAHATLARLAPQLLQALTQPRYYAPPPPPPQPPPVRMVTHTQTTTTYYEGPAPQVPAPPPMPALPGQWPWGRR